MNLFNGRRILITGAGRGNGAALANGLSNYGADIIATDIDGESAAETANSIIETGATAHAFTLDISDLETCRAVAERDRAHGRADRSPGE